MSDEYSPIAEDYADWLAKKDRRQGRAGISPIVRFVPHSDSETHASEVLRELTRALILGQNRATLEEVWLPETALTTLPESIDQRVLELQRKTDALESRLSQVEQYSKRVQLDKNWFELVGTITKLFSRLDSVKQAYCEKTDQGCDITFIHDSSDVVATQQLILSQTLKLEEEFPMFEFDYLILRNDEIDQSEVASQILIFDNARRQ
jgi:hypothetical protein